jgi:hypothetical protein
LTLSRFDFPPFHTRSGLKRSGEIRLANRQRLKPLVRRTFVVTAEAVTHKPIRVDGGIVQLELFLSAAGKPAKLNSLRKKCFLSF